MKILTIAAIFAVSGHAFAEVGIDTPKAAAMFRVNGKTVGPVEAQGAAGSGSKIQKCTPIKDAMTFDGKPAYRCKNVQLVINPLTGTTKWKNL